MLKASKILKLLFLIVFATQLALLIFLLILPQISQAVATQEIGDNCTQDSNCKTGKCLNGKCAIAFTPQVTIGSFIKGTSTAISGTSIGEYIKAIYNYAIGVVGIIAAVVLMWGGIRWMTAGGSAEKVKEAQSWISASLTGLVLALLSYMLLATINPALVKFESITPTAIEEIQTGCCKQCTSGGNLICGPVSLIATKEDDTTTYNCPSGSQPYNPSTHICRLQESGRYEVVNVENCCLYKTSVAGALTGIVEYSCVSGQNFTMSDCRANEQQGLWGASGLLETFEGLFYGYTCNNGRQCVPIPIQ